MKSDREIYQCAKVLVDRLGDDGAIDHCDDRIIRLVGEDDTDGAVIGVSVIEVGLALDCPPYSGGRYAEYEKAGTDIVLPGYCG